MEEFITFNANCVIALSTIDSMIQQFFEICKKELPEEAHTIEVMNFIIDEMNNKIKSMTIEL
jgi:hypothetical protein